jgi:quercetin dioxygenase-like cupin family protein
MALQYVPGGGIKEHDHAFEEGFFIIEGELEGDLDGELHTFGPATTSGAASAARTS